MKKNVHKILAIGLTLVLAVTLAIGLAVPATPALAAETLKVSPTKGVVGDKIDVSGYDYDPGDKVYIYFSSQEADKDDYIDDDLDVWEEVKTTYAGDSGASDEGEIDTSFEVPDELDDGPEEEDVWGGEYFVYTTYHREGKILTKDEFTVTGIGGIEDFAVQSMLIDFDRRPNQDEIVIGKAVFSLPEGASYDLDVDDVTITVDDVLITISAGSFIRAGNKEKYVFTSTEGVEPKVHMKLDFNKGEWSLKVSKIDASAIDNHDGVDLTFAIGSLSAREKLDMWVERLSHTAEY